MEFYKYILFDPIPDGIRFHCLLNKIQTILFPCDGEQKQAQNELSVRTDKCRDSAGLCGRNRRKTDV